MSGEEETMRPVPDERVKVDFAIIVWRIFKEKNVKFNVPNLEALTNEVHATHITSGSFDQWAGSNAYFQTLVGVR